MPIYSLTEFHNELRPVGYTFNLSNNVKSSRDLSGITYRLSRGPRLWQGSIQLRSHKNQTQRQIEALLSAIEEGDMHFQFSPWMSSKPQNYANTGFTNVQTNGTQVAGSSLKLRNLPSDFRFLKGDMLSFAINGVNRLFRIKADTTASGTTATVTIEPGLTAGALPANLTAVAMLNPVCTVQAVPGSVEYGSIRRVITEGASFQFIQSLKV